MNSANEYAKKILAQHTCINETLSLQFSKFSIQVVSNNQTLIHQMRSYFKEFVIAEKDSYTTQVYIFQSDVKTPDVAFQDWTRDPGKTGRKDAFFDLDDGRLCWKARTGMNYVLCNDLRIAYGPALENFSQAINFTLNQHMEWLMNQGGLICHAAAVAYKGSGIALSAFSGGGKSTTALHLMNQGMDFISNDRLFISKRNNGVHMYGIAKQPRINPGTILNNNTLLPLLSQHRINELQNLSKQKLWQLEEKYDAMIDELYGKKRFKLDASIHAHVILNWRHDSSKNTQLTQIDINQREDLLEAIVKSPGPFYMDEQGHGWQNGRDINKQPYLDILSKIKVYEISGKIDFRCMIEPLVDLIKSH